MASTGNITLARRAVDALRTLNDLGGRQPSPAQRAILEQWPGWGPVAPAFDPEELPADWDTISDQINDLLTPDERRDARECVDNSFYTSAHVIETVYGILRAAGFDGGRILEPGCGSGNFMRHAPADLPIDFVGVERDAVSARIAAALNPGAEILHSRLEKAPLHGKFDAVIGNVPFSSQVVYDEISKISGSLHNYFLRRGLAALREGGYLVAVTSRFSLDSSKENEHLLSGSAQADFIGAVRLPSNAFKSEGTSVVADIVVFRKNTTQPRVGWVKPAEHRPVSVRYPYLTTLVDEVTHHTVVTGAHQTRVSAYWAAFPNHVAGTLTATAHFRNPLDVKSTDPAADISTAAAALAEQVHAAPMFAASAGVEPIDAVTTDKEGRKEGSFHLVDGVVLRVQSGVLGPISKPSKELAALVNLRDLTLALLEQEADLDASDESMADLREATLNAYVAYVKVYGPLNRGTLVEGAIDPDSDMPSLSWKRSTLGGFRGDPDYLAVIALENYSQDTNQAGPAAILLRRVNHAPVRVESASSPTEALWITVGETGHVDLDRIRSLLGLTDEATVVEVLGDLIYRNPARKGQWVTARDYLSGNVREKLQQARRAAATSAVYSANVPALEAVVPVDLGPAKIAMLLGNPCLETADITDFIKEVIEGWSRVEKCEATGTWSVDGGGGGMLANTTYGTDHVNALALIGYALNGKAPVVYDEVVVGRTKKKVRNPDQTIAAQEKLNQIQERFAVWVWEDKDRSDRLCTEHNRRFRSYAPRESNGDHLTFPGMSDVLTPYWWQRAGVDQAMSTPAWLCGHDVGLGKTLTMAMLSQTLRRFGLANKPLFVVPNHILEQIARELKQAFPLGKFLIAGREDLAGDGKRLFAARCATGDWDGVVMTHQGFTSIPMHPDTEQEWLDDQKYAYESHLRAGSSYGFGSKEIARKIRALEGRIEKLRTDRRTVRDMIYFEHLGVDYVLYDEAHHAKRLDVASRSEGFSMGASKRATDLLLKRDYLATRRPGQPIISMFTGTPWTNTLAETWVWQKFIQPEALVTAGCDNFDTWASVFVRRQTVVEVSPDGSGFRTATRATHMLNLPDLLNMLSPVSSILSAEQVGLPRPDFTEENIAAEQTPQQQAFVWSLADRYDKAKKAGSKATGSNHIFSILNDGRRVALDPRLVGVPEDSSKIEALCDRVAAVYHANKGRLYPGSDKPGAHQFVFCDQGTPNEHGTHTYGRIKAGLMARGVPAAEVRSIHEAKDDKARAALFAGCRDGSVAVLLGSTMKMGEGTNAQTRMVSVHHADAPWRPSDIKQRNGRALRPGNCNQHVTIYRYVTAGTYDAFMWQALERKVIGFTAMYRNDPNIREVDDISEVAPSETTMKALATGSPLVLRQAEVAQNVRRLRTLKAVDAQSVVTARKEADRLRAEIVDGDRWAKAWAKADEPDKYETTPAADSDLVSIIRQTRKSLENGSAYLYGTQFRWHGFRGRITGSENTLTVKMSTASHDDVGTLDGYALLKGSAVKAAARFEERLTGWEDRSSQQAGAWPQRRAYLEASIARTDQSVAAYTFPQANELRLAEADLAAIEAELRDHAEAQEKEAVAVAA